MIANILLDYPFYRQVNPITKTIYKKYQSIISFACFNLNSLRIDIGIIDNHKQQSENIKQSCFIINDDCKSVLPISHNGLIKLPGIKKYSANMILNKIYNTPTFILDNHFKRIVRLLEFSRSDDLEKIRADFVEIFVEEIWAKVIYLISKHSEQIYIKIWLRYEMWILNKLCPSSYV